MGSFTQATKVIPSGMCNPARSKSTSCFSSRFPYRVECKVSFRP